MESIREYNIVKDLYEYSIGKRDSVDYGTATLISSLDSARYKILMDKDALMDGKDDSKREAVLSVLSDVQHLLQGEDVTLGYKARFYELNMKAALDYTTSIGSAIDFVADLHNLSIDEVKRAMDGEQYCRI